MEGDRYPYPVIVSGAWGPDVAPKTLKNKLLCYFQSHKKSGGGECQVKFCARQALVHFAEQQVRDRVLTKSVHELDFPEKGKVRLEIQMPGARDERETEEPPSFDSSEPMSIDGPQTPGSFVVSSEDTAPAEQEILQEPDSILLTLEGGTVDDDLLEMFFENKRKSGGGPIKSVNRSYEGIQISFENVEDAKEVLSRETHSIQNVRIHVRPYRGHCIVKEQPPTFNSSSVVLENVPETVSPEMLTLLVENISDLPEEDFTLEMIPEKDAAVVTLRNSDGVVEFIEHCNQNTRMKSIHITARLLECTKCIQADNLPPNISADFLSIYFESSKHGGGRVADTQLLHEENSAIVVFFDQKVINSVLTKSHMIKEQAISVHPYYSSLATALYGKERPVLKMPEPVRLPVNQYIGQYLQKNKKIDIINKEMGGYFCELTWLPTDSPCTEVILAPSASLSKERKKLAKLAKKWNERATTRFLSIMSKYKATNYTVTPAAWEVMKAKVDRIVEAGVLIIPEVSKNTVALAGIFDKVDKMEQQFTEILKQAEKEIERKNLSIQENVWVSRAVYGILCSDKFEETIHKVNPDLKLDYNESTSSIELYGLAAEVYGAKSQMLERERTLKQKTINVSPPVLRFIQQANTEELSQTLFSDPKIYALCKTEGSMVVLVGNTQDALVKAEKQIKQEIICKFATLEDNAITNMKEWHELKSSLLEAFNSDKTSLLIEMEDSRVVIAGYSGVVTEAHDQVSNFIDENTQIDKFIPFGLEVVAQFLEEEKKHILLEIEKKKICMDFNRHTRRKQISLFGPRRDVLLMAEKVRDVLSLLHSKVLSVNKPGAKKFFQNLDETWSVTVKQRFHCCVRLAKDGEENEEVVEVEEGLPCYSVRLQCGIVIGVYKDDLAKHPVDVVVNASNEDLKHIGGLAYALLKGAGPRLQTDSDKIVKQRGKLNSGETVVTPAGNLPCKHVIHAVGPRWDDFNQAISESLLKKTVTGSLELAEAYNHRSIGIPAISSGIFGFPLELCVDCIVLSLKEHLKANNWKSTLQQIHLVDSSSKTVEAFTRALKKQFGDRAQSGDHSHFGDPSQRQPVPKPRLYPQREKINPRNPEDVQIVKTKEGLTIILKPGNIQDATTDVIVNSTSTSLDLQSGAVSSALLQKAGPKLSELVKAAAQQENVDVGTVLPTDGCNLSCQKVFHVISPSWQPQSRSEEVLEDIVKDCLKLTEKMSLNSIAFPAIGTGNLGFPKTVAAAAMIGQVIKSSKKKNFQNLQEVYFLLHASDTATITAFSDELEKRFGGKITYKKEIPKVTASVPTKVPATTARTGSAQSSGLIGAISVPTLGVYEMQIGPITLQVKSGDITKEKADVTVNSTNNTFNLKNGVSKAILEAAGQAVELECTQLAAQKNSGFITTTNGGLPCKNIIHAVGPKDPKHIKSLVENILQECDQHQHTSVAFPAFGTGQGGVHPSLVADSMIDALVDFASQKTVQSVKKITIIIFQPQMLEQFHTCMKNKQGTNLTQQKSRFSWMTSFFSVSKPVEKKRIDFELEDKIEPAVIQICGESKQSVDDTASWIEKLILDEHCENNICDEWIAEFGEPEREKLAELQNTLQIRITVKFKQDEVQVSGLTRDVMKACNEIQAMIKKISKEFGQKRNAELVSNIVQWHYEAGGGLVVFDSLANLQLETAFMAKEKTVKIQHYKRSYTVDFSSDSATDDKKRKVKVKRIPKTEAEDDIPTHWDPMSGIQFKLVLLTPQTKEYQDVQAMFAKSCNLAIHKIERVQNLFLWKNYVIKKMSIDAKNGTNNNERQLFHGTAQTHLSTINKNGFNRSFAGLNAAAYGNGTYFAVNANYSAQNTYSKPDATGMKYMYLTKVLTGLFCTGRGGLLTPPAKNAQDPTDLYDSVTDNPANPSMFVIFNDVQAYPDYLISFK